MKGDDAPSRMLLGEIARRLNVRALLVVRVEAGRATARPFLAETGAFDAAVYAPDAGPTFSWSAAAASLARSFGGVGGPGPVGPRRAGPRDARGARDGDDAAEGQSLL